MRILLAAAVIGGAALLGAAIARADTITATYTFPQLSGYSTENGTPFSLFDPALGTLDSITFNATASATFTGGGIFADEAEYDLNLDGLDLIMDATDSKGAAVAFITNYTPHLPAIVLAGFIGPGSSTPVVSVANIGGTTATIISTFGTESIAYNYTPAPVPAVPEPGSLALLGTALLGLGGAGFVRRRCASPAA